MAQAEEASSMQNLAGKAREVGQQTAETARAIGDQVAQAAGTVAESGRSMGSQVLETADRLTDAPARLGEETPAKVYLAGVAGSIFASLVLYIAGRREASLFVGLWAPTILNLALVNKLLTPSHESAAGRRRGGGEQKGQRQGRRRKR